MKAELPHDDTLIDIEQKTPQLPPGNGGRLKRLSYIAGSTFYAYLMHFVLGTMVSRPSYAFFCIPYAFLVGYTHDVLAAERFRRRGRGQHDSPGHQ